MRNDPTMMNAFQTIGVLEDDDALDSITTNFNNAVTDTVAEFLCKQHRKRKLGLPTNPSFCDQRRDLKKTKSELERARYYREINRKNRTGTKKEKETWIA